MAIHVPLTTNLQCAVQHEDDAYIWTVLGSDPAEVTQPVGAWQDQHSSGNNLTEGTTSAKPIRAADGLSFPSNDRIGNNVLGAIASAGSNWTVYLAFNPANLGSYGVVFSFGSSSAESYIAFGANDDATQYGIARISGGSNYGETAGGALGSSLICATIVRSGSTITVYIQNSQVLQDTSVPSPTLNRFHLGALMAFGTFIAYGSYDELKCLYVYDVAHNSTQRTTNFNAIDGTYINPPSAITVNFDTIVGVGEFPSFNIVHSPVTLTLDAIDGVSEFPSVDIVHSPFTLSVDPMVGVGEFPEPTIVYPNITVAFDAIGGVGEFPAPDVVHSPITVPFDAIGGVGEFPAPDVVHYAITVPFDAIGSVGEFPAPDVVQSSVTVNFDAIAGVGEFPEPFISVSGGAQMISLDAIDGVGDFPVPDVVHSPITVPFDAIAGVGEMPRFLVPGYMGNNTLVDDLLYYVVLPKPYK